MLRAMQSLLLLACLHAGPALVAQDSISGRNLHLTLTLGDVAGDLAALLPKLEGVEGVAQVRPDETDPRALNFRLEGPVSLTSLRAALPSPEALKDLAFRVPAIFVVRSRADLVTLQITAETVRAAKASPDVKSAIIDDLLPRMTLTIRIVPEESKAPVLSQVGRALNIRDYMDAEVDEEPQFPPMRAFLALRNVTFYPDGPPGEPRYPKLLNLKEGIRWETSTERALERAREECRPVFLLVTGDC